MDFVPFNINPDDVLPDTKRMVYPSGLDDSDKSHVRYAQPSIKTPTLTIIDAIYNEDGDVIVSPGHYELALSDDFNFLLIMQSKRIIVKIPVFKIDYEMEDTQSHYEKKIKKPKWYEFRKKRLAKKKRDKLVRSAMNPENEQFLYTEATIEWHVDKGYYLIKYESGSVRAWGAIKQNVFGNQTYWFLKSLMILLSWKDRIKGGEKLNARN